MAKHKRPLKTRDADCGVRCARVSGPASLSPAAHRLITSAVRDERVQQRYWAKVAKPQVPGYTCWPYVGSLHPKGHGRFWVGNVRTRRGPVDVCVISHRFGFALAHGMETLDAVPVLAHACDEPSCQNPEHLIASTWGENLEQWHRRRWSPGSPLRDTRGPGGRARAIRAALQNGEDLQSVLSAGRGVLDTNQLDLF